MKRFLSVLIFISILLSHSACYAKDVLVPTNTTIYISPDKTFSSKYIKENEIPASITNDVIINNTTIFKAGDKATLTVGEIRKAKFWGKGGELVISNGYAYDE
ncbi:hypothetical protein II906_10980 [bacterium]|nr:hypothetical protein [bacterium]